METNSSRKSAESLIKDIKRKTNRSYSSEEKIRIVIEGMRGEESVAAICRKYGINDSYITNGVKTSWKRILNL